MNRGFTMIEMVVTLAIIGILAAVLTPIVGRYVDEGRVTRASGDAQTIRDAILNFNKDTGKWPIFQSGVSITVSSATFQVLTGPGTYPGCNIDCTAAAWSAAASKINPLSDALEFNAESYTTAGKFAWRGPYMSGSQADPWGNAYVVNAGALAFGQNKAAFVLSAGPNGAIETSFSQNIGSGASAFVAGGDDIYNRIR